MPFSTGSEDKTLVQGSGLFDPEWYVAKYQGAIRTNLDPLDDYLLFGAAEGRSPGPEFDCEWYLAENSDVAAVESVRSNPLLHYLRHGKNEGRRHRPKLRSGPYERDFYEFTLNSARRSARVVVPLLMRYVSPNSVIDVGCGLGAWLSVFREFGIVDTVDIDGPFFDPALLQIPFDNFLEVDLTQSFCHTRKFDLVVSLEVAEHLPERSAERFVDSLVRLGPVILFSAAIPGQGGTHHLNEQWPDYWAQLFNERSFLCVDCVRRQIWKHEDVAWWYAQNTFLYCDREYLHSNPVLSKELEPGSPLSLVHPKGFIQATRNFSLQRAHQELAGLIAKDAPVILVDGGEATTLFVDFTRIIPFPEGAGSFGGPPADEDSAIAELNRVHFKADYLAIVPSAFLWLDVYPRWHEYIASHFNLKRRTDYLILYEVP